WDGDYNSLLEAWLVEHVQFAFTPAEGDFDPFPHRQVVGLLAEASFHRKWSGRTPNLPTHETIEEFEKEILAAPLVTSDRRTPFHWCLEFPEVLTRGFNAFIGNPPFQGGQKITGALGTDYRDYLVEHVGGGRRGSADLCAY